MPSTNPVAKIADTALKVAGRAVGLVVGGVRGAASLAGQKSGSSGSSAATATTSTTVRPETGAAAQDKREASPPGPVTAPPAEPDASIQEMAEAAVARELAEEPQPTEVADEPSPAPSSEEPETVYSTSTEDADQSPRS